MGVLYGINRTHAEAVDAAGMENYEKFVWNSILKQVV